MTLSDLAKYSMTRSTARFLCDRWASCYGPRCSRTRKLWEHFSNHSYVTAVKPTRHCADTARHDRGLLERPSIQLHRWSALLSSNHPRGHSTYLSFPSTHLRYRPWWSRQPNWPGHWGQHGWQSASLLPRLGHVTQGFFIASV